MKNKGQTNKQPKSASLERFETALLLPDSTPAEALIASSAIVEELLLLAKRFRQMLRGALKDGRHDIALRLKASLIHSAALIESHRCDAMMHREYVRKLSRVTQSPL